jgi:predicted TIM-barrel fold metal-dependent hydrolase
VIIDAHVQFGPGLANDSPLQPPERVSTAGDLLGLLDRARIDRALVHAPGWSGGTVTDDFIDANYVSANVAINEAVRAHPQRLVGCARVQPRYGTQAAQELERCLKDYRFRALYIDNHQDGFSYADVKLLAPLFDLCAQHRVPVLAYTWIAPSQPYQLITLAKAFPKVDLVMIHSGWRLLGDAQTAADAAPNLYFESSFGNTGVARLAKGKFADRVLFGSNTPFGIAEVELQRVRKWGQLNQSQLDAVLGGNAARVLGLRN